MLSFPEDAGETWSRKRASILCPKDAGGFRRPSTLLSGPGMQCVIAAVSSYFKAVDRVVREAALKAIVQIVDVGDKGIITVVATCLQDAHEDVRLAALQALS